MPNLEPRAVEGGLSDRAGAGTETARCRRTHERRPMAMSLVLAELGAKGEPGEPWVAESFDVSRSGFGLHSRRMVHVGRLLLVAVPPRAEHPGRLLCGRVMQSRYSEGEGYVVGIRFEECPRSPEIDRWWARHVGGRRSA